MKTRKLNESELARLASGRGVTDLDVTCEGDSGHGPCGTYHDWCDGYCADGHEIEVRASDTEGVSAEALRQLADEHENDRYEDLGEAAFGRED